MQNMETALKCVWFSATRAIGTRRICKWASSMTAYSDTAFSYPEVKGYVALTIDDGLCRTSGCSLTTEVLRSRECVRAPPSGTKAGLAFLSCVATRHHTTLPDVAPAVAAAFLAMPANWPPYPDSRTRELNLGLACKLSALFCFATHSSLLF